VTILLTWNMLHPLTVLFRIYGKSDHSDLFVTYSPSVNINIIFVPTVRTKLRFNFLKDGEVGKS
jgi:hypothetical protein